MNKLIMLVACLSVVAMGFAQDKPGAKKPTTGHMASKHKAAKHVVAKHKAMKKVTKPKTMPTPAGVK